MNIRLLLVALLLSVSISSSADEGMWMIQDINEALERNMKARGLKLAANEIYNADAPGAAVSDAVVSLGFYCTGSIISNQGLVITNHHCAYGNIAKLSTPDHNYLEEGFWAMSSEQEIPIQGERFFFLKRVFDVTEERAALERELRAAGKPSGSRRVSSLLEARYAEATGLECSLNTMWAGEKSYISVYKVYDDIRLVAAPPLSIGYFGGETDNWAWPRHNCDFAMYRIYENGRPANTGKSLKVSLRGYQPGSFAMVIGYPGTTNRYCSSSEVDYQQAVSLPITNKIRGKQMDIVRDLMNADPSVRMKYSDWYFNLCNVQENNSGQVECYKRFRVKAGKEAQEKEMQKWIYSDPSRSRTWGNVLADLKSSYKDTEWGEIQKIYYRETMFRGGMANAFLLRAGNLRSLENSREALLEGIAATDPRVEKALLAHAAEEFFTNVDSYYYGPFQIRMYNRFGTDWTAMADYLWEHCLLSSADKVDAVESKEMILNDPLRRFITDSPVSAFNDRDDQLSRRNRTNELERLYKRILYRMRYDKGVPQYPDANSTMRITYGTVGGYEPVDGIACRWYTTPAGILEKYDPASYDFNLDPREVALLQKEDWGRWGFTLDGKKRRMIVDFLTDNDITGGNSGSPVLDANGNLIGLAFDGNIESLASDASFTEGYNKCINTDIRFVMWVLDKYAGMKRIIKEIDFVK